MVFSHNKKGTLPVKVERLIFKKNQYGKDNK